MRPATSWAAAEQGEGRKGVPITYSWPELQRRWGKVIRFPRLRLDIVRHGETFYNRQALVTGSSDVDLSDRGRLQAATVGKELRPPYEMLFASSLRRSIETLQIAARAQSINQPMAIDERLRERSLGEFEGKPRRFIPQYSTGDLDFAPPGGESYRHVVQRCLSFLLDLHETSRDWPAERAVLICTHVGPIRVLFGIVYAVRDPARMLSLEWQNTVFTRAYVEGVPWPQFLERHYAGI